MEPTDLADPTWATRLPAGFCQVLRTVWAHANFRYLEYS
jgi:hypothetical protein